jgi:hypothetical protein
MIAEKYAPDLIREQYRYSASIMPEMAFSLSCLRGSGSLGR